MDEFIEFLDQTLDYTGHKWSNKIVRPRLRIFHGSREVLLGFIGALLGMSEQVYKVHLQHFLAFWAPTIMENGDICKQLTDHRQNTNRGSRERGGGGVAREGEREGGRVLQKPNVTSFPLSHTPSAQPHALMGCNRFFVQFFSSSSGAVSWMAVPQPHDGTFHTCCPLVVAVKLSELGAS